MQEGHFTQAVQLPPGQMENEIATLCVIVKKTTQSTGCEQNLCPLRRREAGAVLPGNNGFENVHLLKCALSRCPVKDDELLSVYSGFCSSQSNREISSPETSQGASGKLKFRLSLSRAQADSRYRA